MPWKDLRFCDWFWIAVVMALAFCCFSLWRCVDTPDRRESPDADSLPSARHFGPERHALPRPRR